VENRLQDLRAPLRERDFRILWFAQALSELGDWAARLALAILVFERTGSPTLTALVTGLSVLPWVGIGQVLATLGDKYPRRSVMLYCDVLRAAAFITMVAPVPVWALLILAFVAGLATPPFSAARSALLPTTVPQEKYADAIALAILTSQFAAVAGYAAGGGLVAFVGPRLALAVNACTFLGSALLVARLSGGRSGASQHTVGRSFRNGARAISRDAFVRRAVGFYAIITWLTIGVETLIPVYAAEELTETGLTVGAMASVVPLGAVMLTFALPVRGTPRRLLQVSGLTAGVPAAIGALAFAAGLDMPFILLGFLAVGAISAAGVPTNAVAGTRLPDDVRATSFGIVQGLLQGAVAAGAALSGLLASHIGARSACTSMLVATAVVGIWAATRPPTGVPRASGARLA
jgi:MFS family permease